MNDPGGLCASCALTVERPNDADTAGLAEFARAEAAKRRLIAELHELKLPIVGRDEDPDYGLGFRLLSSAHEKVLTGHENGVITLDLAEGDDVHREQLRVEMDEPYRTLLGHFRHEVGHYYFYRLITPSSDYLARFNELFGDPDADYQEALDRHYSDGAPEGWQESFVSSYATMHRRRGLGRDVRPLPAHPRHPGHLGLVRPGAGVGDLRPAGVGPQRFSHHHRDVAAVVVVAEHGEPFDGPRRPVPVRAAGGGSGQDAVHPQRDRRGDLGRREGPLP